MNNPCPFCSYENLKMNEDCFEHAHGKAFYIECTECGARGPWRIFNNVSFEDKEKSCFEAWNERK